MNLAMNGASTGLPESQPASLSQNLVCATGVVEGTRVRRQPFVGNIVPSNRISPVGKKILAFYDKPNQPGNADGTNNYFYSGKGIDDYDNELGRLDYSFSDRNKLSYNFRHNDRLLSTGNRFNTPATGYHLNEINWGSSLDHVYTFTPTTALNTRFNWNRKTELRTQMGDGTDYLAQMGFPSNVVNAATRKMFPSVSISGYESLGYGSGRTQRFDNFQIFSSLNKVTGKHMLKMGADRRQQNYGRYQWGDGAGSYSFSTDWVRGPYNNSSAPPMGGGLASVLLGLPTGGSFVTPPAQSSRNRYISLFVQDDFRLSKDLTLNFGPRYERELAPTERYSRILRGFDPNVASPISADKGATWGPEIVLRDDGGTWDLGYPRSVVRPDDKVVAIYYFNTPRRSEQHIAAREPAAGPGVPQKQNEADNLVRQ